MTAETIIEKLNLTSHPEGGFYRETYRADKSITLDNGKVRTTGTAIYYLLKDTDKSHFHKINADEIWLFHEGEPLEVLMITHEGNIETKILGNRLDLDQEPQVTIAANVWFAARIIGEKGFTLVSCIVAPGFEFEDFVLGDKDELIKLFPNIKDEIENLCL